MRVRNCALLLLLIQGFCFANPADMDSLKRLTATGNDRTRSYNSYEVSIFSMDTSEIIAYITQARRLAGNKPDHELTALQYYATGRYYLYLNFYNPLNKFLKDSAMHYLNNSYLLINNINNKLYQAGLLGTLGAQKNAIQYINYIDSANRILININRIDLVIENLNRLGYSLFGQGYTMKADSILRELVHIYSRFNKNEALLSRVTIASKSYESHGEFQLALKLLNDYRWLTDHVKDNFSKWDFFYKRSIYEWHCNDFLSSIKSCDTALKFAKKHGKSHEISLSFEMLGIIYNDLQMWDEALNEGLRKALLYAKRISNDTTISRIRMNMAALYMDRRDFNIAVNELLDNKELFSRVNRNKRDDGYFVYLFNILECYFYLDKPNEMRKLFPEFELESNSIHRWSSKSQYNLAYARYYYLLKDYSNSEKYLSLAWSSYNSDVGFNKLAEAILSIYHIVLLKQGKLSDAYKFALEWSYIKDSINAEIDNKEMGRFEKEQEIKRETEIQRLEKNRLEEKEKANTRIIVFLIIAAFFLIIFAIVVYRERSKSEKLLLNILPKKIAQRLKKKEKYIAERYNSASVIFIDIANFTKLSSGITPEKLVEILNDIFTKFDELTEKHGLEKIKTIGDCYLAVAGIPEPKVDHAFATADMALEVMSSMKSYSTFDGLNITFRIGIDCGPVVAGIIGKNKFIYDLWGDTVNTASRMEDYGIIGEIQVSDRFKKEIDSSGFERKHYYQWIDRGLIEMKGKGNMKTWILREPE